MTFTEAWLVQFLTPLYERQHQPGAARRARAVWLRCAEQWTYRAIGEDLGVGSNRAHQLFETTMSKIRRACRGSEVAERRHEILATGHDGFLSALYGPDWRHLWPRESD